MSDRESPAGSVLPPDYGDAARRLHRGLADCAAAGISEETQVAVLMTELMPRLQALHGGPRAAWLLRRLAEELDPSAVSARRQ